MPLASRVVTDVIELSDGGRIEIRPIRPEDRGVLERGLERMGSESRYWRFFAPISRFSEGQLAYLTEVDHHDHEALVALECDTGEGIGVARYVRVDADVAEPAIVVIDDWQRRGVGRMLLDRLSDRAREEGVKVFLAPVLADNAVAIAALSRLGETSITSRGSEVEMLIELEEQRGAAATLHRLLRHAAEQTVRPSYSFWHRLGAAGRTEDDGHAGQARPDG